MTAKKGFGLAQLKKLVRERFTIAKRIAKEMKDPEEHAVEECMKDILNEDLVDEQADVLAKEEESFRASAPVDASIRSENANEENAIAEAVKAAQLAVEVADDDETAEVKSTAKAQNMRTVEKESGGFDLAGLKAMTSGMTQKASEAAEKASAAVDKASGGKVKAVTDDLAKKASISVAKAMPVKAKPKSNGNDQTKETTQSIASSFDMGGLKSMASGAAKKAQAAANKAGEAATKVANAENRIDLNKIKSMNVNDLKSAAGDIAKHASNAADLAGNAAKKIATKKSDRDSDSGQDKPSSVSNLKCPEDHEKDAAPAARQETKKSKLSIDSLKSVADGVAKQAEKAASKASEAAGNITAKKGGKVKNDAKEAVVDIQPEASMPATKESKLSIGNLKSMAGGLAKQAGEAATKASEAAGNITAKKGGKVKNDAKEAIVDIQPEASMPATKESKLSIGNLKSMAGGLAKQAGEAATKASEAAGKVALQKNQKAKVDIEKKVEREEEGDDEPRILPESTTDAFSEQGNGKPSS